LKGKLKTVILSDADEEVRGRSGK